MVGDELQILVDCGSVSRSLNIGHVLNAQIVEQIVHFNRRKKRKTGNFRNRDSRDFGEKTHVKPLFWYIYTYLCCIPPQFQRNHSFYVTLTVQLSPIFRNSHFREGFSVESFIFPPQSASLTKLCAI